MSGLKFSEAAGEMKQRFCALQAKTMLQENWETYLALVKAMQQRATVTECLQVIVPAAN